MGTLNKQTDLHNILFAQLETLSDANLKGENLLVEISRSKAMCDISTNLIRNGELALKTGEFMADYGNYDNRLQLPEFLGK